MNYFEALFMDIAKWINEANNRAATMGMQSDSYWKWVMESSGALCDHYQNNELVMMIMLDLIKWLENHYKNSIQKKGEKV